MAFRLDVEGVFGFGETHPYGNELFRGFRKAETFHGIAGIFHQRHVGDRLLVVFGYGHPFGKEKLAIDFRPDFHGIDQRSVEVEDAGLDALENVLFAHGSILRKGKTILKLLLVVSGTDRK